MLSTSQILDCVMASLSDQSAEMRGKALVWLNHGMRSFAAMRPWLFLQKSATITPTADVFAWPSDFARVVSIRFGKTCLYPSDAMSDEDYAADAYSDRYRWRNVGAGFEILPGVDSCVLTYIQDVPAYTDSLTATVFPEEMGDALTRYVLARAYEYDMDERSTGALMVSQLALKAAKSWDNKLRPLPRAERRSIQWGNT